MNTVTVKQLLRTALVLATAAGMTACETQKAMPTPSIMTAEIKLHVVENPKTLKVIEGPVCPGEPGLGCIDVPEGETAIIEFRQLSGTWDLTTMWICQESDKPSGRPTSSNCSLTAPCTPPTGSFSSGPMAWRASERSIRFCSSTRTPSSRTIGGSWKPVRKRERAPTTAWCWIRV